MWKIFIEYQKVEKDLDNVEIEAYNIAIKSF